MHQFVDIDESNETDDFDDVEDDRYLMDSPDALSRAIHHRMGVNGSYTRLSRSASESHTFIRQVDSSGSMGSFMAKAAFLLHLNDGEPSVRSKKRHHLNIVFGTLLVIVTALLLIVTSTVTYYHVILPNRRERALNAAIRAHAAADAALVQQCRHSTWQTACDSLAGAGARRSLEQLLPFEKDFSPDADDDLTVDDDDHDTRWDENGNEEENMERHFLESDNPTITYDPTCLRIYRLTMMWNITFPYRSSQLIEAGGGHTMALFIQHGALRDAADYFCSFKKLMLKQDYRPVSEILIIAPHFQYGHDEYLHPRDAFWNTTKPWGDWRVGAESDPDCCGDSGRTVSSFNVLDYMLAILTNKQLYPRMNKISFLGHSAGGQMVQRYAVMSTLAALWDMEADIDLKFVIANPSSYTYLDNRRFEYSCGNCECNIHNCTCDKDCTDSTSTLAVPAQHSVGSKWPCYQWNYDRWPYGLGSFTGDDGNYYIPYALRDGYAGVERALRVYRKLDVVYIVGQNDTCNDGLPTCDKSCWKRNVWDKGEWQCYRNQMDSRCPAMLQGPCRRTRGHQYMNYLQRLYSRPTHTLWEIPGVGHDASAIFGSDIGMEVLFAHPKKQPRKDTD